MSPFRQLLISLSLALAIAPAAAAQDYTVIVNDAVPATTLMASELSRVFQRTALRWPNGLTVEPVDQADHAPVRARFSQVVFRKTVAQIKAYWQTQVFQGRAVPPVELASDAEVIAFVQSHAGAIGYVSANATLPAGVRRIRVVR